jgi:hypothetical protein
MLSARGWRTWEPGSDDLAPERPELVQDIALSLLARGLTQQEVATIAGFAAPSHNSLFRAGALRAL